MQHRQTRYRKLTKALPESHHGATKYKVLTLDALPAPFRLSIGGHSLAHGSQRRSTARIRARYCQQESRNTTIIMAKIEFTRPLDEETDSGHILAKAVSASRANRHDSRIPEIRLETASSAYRLYDLTQIDRPDGLTAITPTVREQYPPQDTSLVEHLWKSYMLAQITIRWDRATAAICPSFE